MCEVSSTSVGGRPIAPRVLVVSFCSSAPHGSAACKWRSGGLVSQRKLESCALLSDVDNIGVLSIVFRFDDCIWSKDLLRSDHAYARSWLRVGTTVVTAQTIPSTGHETMTTPTLLQYTTEGERAESYSIRKASLATCSEYLAGK